MNALNHFPYWQVQKGGLKRGTDTKFGLREPQETPLMGSGCSSGP